MTIKPIKDWGHIFLDSSVIINLILSLKDGATDPVALFTNKLITYLNDSNTGSEQRRQFYVSSITISEILSKVDTGERPKAIINAINSENVTFVAFDNQIAELINDSYHSILGTTLLNSFARELSWPSHDLVLAREWITKDTMILASSQYLECDVALTLDKKTMYKVAKKLAVPCALTFPDYFDASEKFIIGYHHDKAMANN